MILTYYMHLLFYCSIYEFWTLYVLLSFHHSNQMKIDEHKFEHIFVFFTVDFIIWIWNKQMISRLYLLHSGLLLDPQ